jgi:hypothetical protein
MDKHFILRKFWETKGKTLITDHMGENVVGHSLSHDRISGGALR